MRCEGFQGGSFLELEEDNRREREGAERFEAAEEGVFQGLFDRDLGRVFG